MTAPEHQNAIPNDTGDIARNGVLPPDFDPDNSALLGTADDDVTGDGSAPPAPAAPSVADEGHDGAAPPSSPTAAVDDDAPLLQDAREAPASWHPVLRTFHSLLELACGRDLPKSEGKNARRLQLVFIGMLSSMGLCALWGVAAGSTDVGLLLTNVLKVPLVVLLSVVGAVPATLLAMRLTNQRMTALDLLVAVSAGTFGGTLTLGVLAPVVTVYYQTSAHAGPLFAMGSVAAALAVGAAVFVRATLVRRPEGSSRMRALMPIGVMLGMLGVLMVQMVALASPMIPEQTFFDRGVDGVLQ